MKLVSSSNRQAIDALKQGYDRLNPFYKLFFPSAMKRFLNQYQIPEQPGSMVLPANQFETLNRLYRSVLHTGRFRRWLFSSLTAFSNTAAASSLGPWMDPVSDGLGVNPSVVELPVSQNFRAMMASENPRRLGELLHSMQALRSGDRTYMNQNFTPMWAVDADNIREVCTRLAEIPGLSDTGYTKCDGNKIGELRQLFDFIEISVRIAEQEKPEFYELAAKHRSPAELNQGTTYLIEDNLFTMDNFRYCIEGEYPLFRRSALHKLDKNGLDTPENRQACAASQNPHYMADCLILLNRRNLLDDATRALCLSVPNNTSLSYFYHLLNSLPVGTLTRERFEWFASYASHGEALLRDTHSFWQGLVQKNTFLDQFYRDVDDLINRIGNPTDTPNLSATMVQRHFREAGHIQDAVQHSPKRRIGFLDQTPSSQTASEEDESSLSSTLAG